MDKGGFRVAYIGTYLFIRGIVCLSSLVNIISFTMSNVTSLAKRDVFNLIGIVAISLCAIVFMLPSPAHAATLTRELEQGMSGDDVSTLQTFLAAYGTVYPEKLITGFFGPATKGAVMRFQTQNNLSAVGRVGPLTMSSINDQMVSGHMTSSSDDVSAPIMTTEMVSTGPSSASFTWGTNEVTRSRVLYGMTWPFFLTTAPSVSTTGFGSTANVVLTGLQSHTTYYYVLESMDSSGNITQTLGKPVVTQ